MQRGYLSLDASELVFARGEKVEGGLEREGEVWVGRFGQGGGLEGGDCRFEVCDRGWEGGELGFLKLDGFVA